MVTIKDYRDKGTERHNYSMDFEDSEEPTQQKINESYRPKITIQGFLQTDANNIKMNARLINDNNMRNKFDDKSNILKSKESITIKDINNTKWLAGDGTINGDFINKELKVVYRDNYLLVIGTSW